MRKASLVLLSLLLFAAACTQAKTQPANSPPRGSGSAPQGSPGAEGIFKLDHLIFVVMENRSFDHYFGTYPGADGPAKNTCIPDSALGRCVRPWHDTNQRDEGGPHTRAASIKDVNGGKMDGFVETAIDQAENICAREPTFGSCEKILGPHLEPEVMGYHNRHEIPNYWEYADQFVLQDRMFAPTDSWTLPSHLFLVSAWSAICKNNKPMSCRSALGAPGPPLDLPKNKKDTPYAWTDITYLLHKRDVSWAYYVAPGPTCYENACDRRENLTTGFQNPMPGFATVKQNGQRENIRPYTDYFKSADEGTLPSVSWVMPAIGESDHPGHSSITDGQAFVTKVVNAAMKGPGWDSTAIFVTWDDWGGFYDHVKPPKIDQNGYGIRVPAFMIGPYAKKGFIDHQTLTFDAYLKLIEDRFLNGQRLDPKTDGRPDSRPTVREEVKLLGDLAKEFDFDQEPRQPVVLDPNP